MRKIESLVNALMPIAIARRIDIPLLEAMEQYDGGPACPASFRDYQHAIGSFVDRLVTTCVTHGGSLSPSEAYGRGREAIEREYQRRGGDIVTAYNDAHDGTNNGWPGQKLIIKDRIRYEMVGRHVQWVFDEYVQPNSEEEKVAIMREFLAFYGPILGDAIDCDDPKRYAKNYHDLVQAIVESVDRTASVARRL